MRSSRTPDSARTDARSAAPAAVTACAAETTERHTPRPKCVFPPTGNGRSNMQGLALFSKSSLRKARLPLRPGARPATPSSPAGGKGEWYCRRSWGKEVQPPPTQCGACTRERRLAGHLMAVPVSSLTERHVADAERRQRGVGREHRRHSFRGFAAELVSSGNQLRERRVFLQRLAKRRRLGRPELAEPQDCQGGQRRVVPIQAVHEVRDPAGPSLPPRHIGRRKTRALGRYCRWWRNSKRASPEKPPPHRGNDQSVSCVRWVWRVCGVRPVARWPCFCSLCCVEGWWKPGRPRARERAQAPRYPGCTSSCPRSLPTRRSPPCTAREVRFLAIQQHSSPAGTPRLLSQASVLGHRSELHSLAASMTSQRLPSSGSR